MAQNCATASNIQSVAVFTGLAAFICLGTFFYQWLDFLPHTFKAVVQFLIVSALALQANSVLSRKALNPTGTMLCDWANEIVVVTGGSRGIGRALVEQLESLGATTVILDLSPPTFRTNERTYYFQTDVSSHENVNETCERIVAKLGPPTILVANAGLYICNTILGASEHDLRRTFDVNVFGTLFCIRSFLPAMVARNHGHVVVVSSIKAYLTTIKAVDYAASKAALHTIVEGLQTELKHSYGNSNVKASGIYPAVVKTELSGNIVQPFDSFFLPVLDPKTVADQIVRILNTGRSQMVLMPVLSGIAPWIHALPHWLRVAVQNLAAKTMNNASVKTNNKVHETQTVWKK